MDIGNIISYNRKAKENQEYKKESRNRWLTLQKSNLDGTCFSPAVVSVMITSRADVLAKASFGKNPGAVAQ